MVDCLRRTFHRITQKLVIWRQYTPQRRNFGFRRCISLVDLSYRVVHLVYLRKQLWRYIIKVFCLIPVIVNGLWATAKLRRGSRLMRKSPCVYCILNVDRKLAPKNRSKYPTFNLILQSQTVSYMRQSYYSN